MMRFTFEKYCNLYCCKRWTLLSASDTLDSERCIFTKSSYANIFMGQLEKRLLSQAPFNPTYWFRFIDDVKMLWEHGNCNLDTFLSFCNNFHPSIKFTSESSPSEIPFLDTLTKIVDGRIVTDLFVKPTDKHQYLLPSSCHPPHVAKNIPFGQALRYKRICSTDETFNHRARTLVQNFTDRGYDKSDVLDKVDKVRVLERSETLKYNEKQQSDRVPLVTTYHPDLPKLSKILRKRWDIITTSDRLTNVFTHHPVMAFRRPKNLKDMLVRAKINKPVRGSGGCSPCDKPRCQVCFCIQRTDLFQSKATGSNFTIRQHINCNTTNLIYIIECRQCQVQYVGESRNALRIRFNNHKSSIRHPNTVTPISIHFNLPDHSISDIILTGIDHNPEWNDDERKRKESFWILTLCSKQPVGLNLAD